MAIGRPSEGTTIDIPAAICLAAVRVHGTSGTAWLDRLPDRVAEFAHRWQLTVGAPFAGLSYNYAAPAVDATGAEVVLKLGVPCGELTAEIEALRLFDGEGAVRLLNADANAGVLLLERLRPGTALSAATATGDERRAIRAAAAVMRRLWRPVRPAQLASSTDMPPAHLAPGTDMTPAAAQSIAAPTATEAVIPTPSPTAVPRTIARQPAVGPFPTIADWSNGFVRLRARFGGGTGPLPAQWVRRAESLFAELLATSGPPALLHGDLHHGNILAAKRQPWLAIDPKGLVGEPAYDAAVFLRSVARRALDAGADDGQPARTLARPLRQLADELDLDRRRLRDWAVAQAVLSAWWHVEDHEGGWDREMECAQRLASLDQ